MSALLEGLIEKLDTERIRQGAVQILAEVGMAAPEEKVRRRLAEEGLRVQAGRVYFPPERVEQFMARQRAQAAPEHIADTVALHTGSHALYHFNPETETIQRLTRADLERYTKLVGALHQAGVLASAFCVGQPSDVEPPLAPLWQQFIAARFLPDPVFYVYAIDTAAYVSEMAAVLGKQMSMGVHPISPLTLGGEEFELAVRLIEAGKLSSAGAAGMPVLGVTAPLDWQAGWAQAVAEAVGTALALEALGAKHASAFAALYAADMRCGCFVFGSPEHVLLTLTEAKVNREILGQPRRAAKALNTTAKTPGAQAAAEKMAHVIVALLAGYRQLSGMGVLAVDEIFSPQQIFVDAEIVGHAWRVACGLEPTYAQEDITALVQEGLNESAHFMTAPRTLESFRDFYWTPGLFDRRPTGAFLAQPQDLLEQAQKQAQEYIAQYAYELAEDKQRAMQDIIEHARKQWLTS